VTNSKLDKRTSFHLILFNNLKTIEMKKTCAIKKKNKPITKYKVPEPSKKTSPKKLKSNPKT
jgi:hypothetical protein